MKSRSVPESFPAGTALLFGLLLMGTTASASALTDKQTLGKLLFFDTDLSSPDGQACGSCHDPSTAFSDPDKGLPVSGGVLPLRVGPRNAPTITYLATAPDFAPIAGGFIGGQFWDSRAANLFEQAKLPFLNTLEMHNPNRKLVVHDVEKGEYADLFRQVYGTNVFDNYEAAYNDIADAIAAFERSPELNKFNSKFDLFLQGEVDLTTQETEGLAIFNGKGQCFRCHVTTPNSDGDPPVFTSFRFANIGVPRNPDNPFYSLLLPLNPDGAGFVDDGLGGFLRDMGEPPEVYEPQLGRMNFPTVRNVAKTSPYMHNGVFPELKTVVHFFNTRDVLGSGFDPPETPTNVSTVIGNLGLTEEEENALVAFMETLTDDYEP
ncbi:MAG: cytochrome c peroxidase [Armatimonadota bacterium]|nr:cytochrome c peroxidase [Armatimonadota bacterium]